MGNHKVRLEITELVQKKAENGSGECVIMGDFNHGHIQWESLECAGGDDDAAWPLA